MLQNLSDYCFVLIATRKNNKNNSWNIFLKKRFCRDGYNLFKITKSQIRLTIDLPPILFGKSFLTKNCRKAKYWTGFFFNAQSYRTRVSLDFVQINTYTQNLTSKFYNFGFPSCILVLNSFSSSSIVLKLLLPS